jgi:hypothetical protein
LQRILESKERIPPEEETELLTCQVLLRLPDGLGNHQQSPWMFSGAGVIVDFGPLFAREHILDGERMEHVFVGENMNDLHIAETAHTDPPHLGPFRPMPLNELGQVANLLDEAVVSVVVDARNPTRTLRGRPAKEILQFDPRLGVGPMRFLGKEVVVNGGFVRCSRRRFFSSCRSLCSNLYASKLASHSSEYSPARRAAR